MSPWKHGLELSSYNSHLIQSAQVFLVQVLISNDVLKPFSVNLGFYCAIKHVYIEEKHQREIVEYKKD